MRLLFIICVLSTFYSFSENQAIHKETFFHMTNDIFLMLANKNTPVAEKINILEEYENIPNKTIRTLAKEISHSLTINNADQLEDTISSLGQLIKHSIAHHQNNDMAPFILTKKNLQDMIKNMEVKLSRQSSMGTQMNFHKIMMEAMANKQYDLALYAYCKIAETRLTI